MIDEVGSCTGAIRREAQLRVISWKIPRDEVVCMPAIMDEYSGGTTNAAEYAVFKATC
jgi:hypothetical protein